jgi:hypothetical protein
VQIRMIAQVDFCESFKGDFALPADAVATVKNP